MPGVTPHFGHVVNTVVPYQPGARVSPLLVRVDQYQTRPYQYQTPPGTPRPVTPTASARFLH